MLLKTKRKVSLLLIFVIGLAMVFCVFTEKSTGEEAAWCSLNTSCVTEEAFTVNEAAANKAYSRLLDHFREEERKGKGTGYRVSGISETGFPAYYSGAYINQNGNLVIMLNSSLTTEERQSIQTELERITVTSDLYFRNAEVPYSKLVNVMTGLNAFIASEEYLEQDSYHIYGFGIDDCNNLVQIESDIPDSEIREQFLRSAGIDKESVWFFPADEKAE